MKLHSPIAPPAQFDDYTPTLEAYQEEIRILGLVGLIDLGHCKLLFYIKRRRLVANVGDRSVYQVMEGNHVVVFRKPYPTLGEVGVFRANICLCHMQSRNNKKLKRSAQF